MNLVHLRRVVDDLLGQNPDLDALSRLPAAARPVVMASMAARHEGPVLLVTARTDQAEELVALAGAYLPTDRQPVLWDTPQSTPYEQLPFEQRSAAQRVRIMSGLLDGGTPIIVAGARNLMHLTMAPADLVTMRRTLSSGERINSDGLMRWASEMGYQRVPLVFEPGTVAQRGGVIDLFPPDADDPIRIDLFGDEIESIRVFDPQSQRSRHELPFVDLLPPVDIPVFKADQAASQLRAIDDRPLRAEVRAEWRALIDRVEHRQLPAGVDVIVPYYGESICWLDAYLPVGTLVIFDDQRATMRTIRDVSTHANELRDAFIANGELPAPIRAPFVDQTVIEPELARFQSIDLRALPEDEEEHAQSLFRLPPQFAGRTARATADVKALLD